MKIILQVSRIALMAMTIAVAGQPDWVINHGKSDLFPESLYLTGYGIATVQNGITEEHAEQSAIGNARKNLIEKIRVNIQVLTASKSEESGDKYSSFFSSAVQSTSTLEIQGLETEQYSIGGIVHAYARVKREALQNTYQKKVFDLKKNVEERVKHAELLETQSKATEALSEYLSCYPLLRQLEEDQSILTFVKVSNSLDELQQIASSNEITFGKIREEIAKLIQRPINSPDDLAWYLAYQLKEQLQDKVSTKPDVLVTPLKYQDTPLGSSFSRYFNQVLEQKLSEVAQWNTIQKAKAFYVITGSYWEQKDLIKFIVSMRRVADGKTIASAEASVQSKMLSASSRSLTPENIKSALIDQKVFASGESAGGGLAVEAWTNKQTTGNLFIEGEKMTVTARVNMPCYLRFIYLDASGNKVLLLDNYYIDQSKVNLAYEIPQQFECSSPFGSEVLQIFVRTEQFNELPTKNIDGYAIIQDDLKNIVMTTRGMKTVNPSTMQAETRVTITTMKN